MRSRVRRSLLGLTFSALGFVTLGVSDSAQTPGRVLWQFETGG